MIGNITKIRLRSYICTSSDVFLPSISSLTSQLDQNDVSTLKMCGGNKDGGHPLYVDGDRPVYKRVDSQDDRLKKDKWNREKEHDNDRRREDGEERMSLGKLFYHLLQLLCEKPTETNCCKKKSCSGK